MNGHPGWSQGDIRDVISIGKLVRKSEGPLEIEQIMNTMAKYDNMMITGMIGPGVRKRDIWMKTLLEFEEDDALSLESASNFLSLLLRILLFLNYFRVLTATIEGNENSSQRQKVSKKDWSESVVNQLQFRHLPKIGQAHSISTSLSISLLVQCLNLIQLTRFAIFVNKQNSL
jgi:hypothetical protein